MCHSGHCGDQRTNGRSHFSTSTTWVPGGVASAFINQTISPALYSTFLGTIKPFSKGAHILHSSFVFQDKVCLCSSGCPGTHSVDQAGLELRDSPAFAPQVLELKVCTTTIRHILHSYQQGMNVATFPCFGRYFLFPGVDYNRPSECEGGFHLRFHCEQ
ncbi:hypothetical protein LEMLEM_LOCUS19714 [Lemmus lemmus]